MTCTCRNRTPCPVHKDQPLPICELANCRTWVVNLWEHWPKDGVKTWSFTVADDAIQIFQSEKFTSKRAVIEKVESMFK